jgi:hypothetical protein
LKTGVKRWHVNPKEINMRKISIAGLCLVAVIALSGMSAGSALAALEFKSTVNGNLFASAKQTQVFTTKAGTVECTKLKIEKGVAELKPSTQKATIKYENCTAFTFIGATISPAEYEFNINGKVKVLKTIKIEAAGCVSTVEPQEIGTVKYNNTNRAPKPNAKASNSCPKSPASRPAAPAPARTPKKAKAHTKAARWLGSQEATSPPSRTSGTHR